MSIEGRINVDVLFHDRDGTASLKVLSLQESKEYTTGKVAIVHGTAGTTNVTFTTSDAGAPSSTYRNASGELVSFSQITTVALKATATNRPLVFTDDDLNLSFTVNGLNLLVYPCSVVEPGTIAVRSASGTASYTILLYGT